MVGNCRRNICDGNKPVLVCWARRAPPARQSSPCYVHGWEFGNLWYFVLPFFPGNPMARAACGCLCAGDTAGCTKIIRGGFSRSLPHQPIVVWRAASCLLGLQLQVLPQLPLTPSRHVFRARACRAWFPAQPLSSLVPSNLSGAAEEPFVTKCG